MHIFTYGTLMFPEVWRAVAGRSFETVEGKLRDYSIYRVVDAVYPGIVVADGNSSVPGVVYLDVDGAAVARLDRFEDDFYVRQTLMIDCEDGQRRRADAYVVPPEQRHVLTDEPWTRESFIASGGLEQFIRRFAGFARVAEGEEQ
jgi:gamma-glutamylcyclotransferase (GGCT)/AIG2-like uncharacterized protein YtfP